ncbi:MAG: hypothetical protein SF053_15520 [Bacteroidia bacterium]|nr:hypothetical protein [Bacteroidia bacterium]
MDWIKLKQHVYFEDGSLRDIYVRRMIVDDWQRWIEHANSNGIVKFTLDGVHIADEIDFAAVSKYWGQPGSEFPSASLTIGNILLQVYFGDESELELDLSPQDIQTIDDHRTLMDYLLSVSNLLQKNVELTMENPAAVNEVLLSIRFGEVRVIQSEIL